MDADWACSGTRQSPQENIHESAMVGPLHNHNGITEDWQDQLSRSRQGMDGFDPTVTAIPFMTAQRTSCRDQPSGTSMSLAYSTCAAEFIGGKAKAACGFIFDHHLQCQFMQVSPIAYSQVK